MMRTVLFLTTIALLIALAPASVVAKEKEWTGPKFELTALDGSTMNQKDVFTDGEVYLVDFWASWCKPCNQYLPHLQDMVDTYGDRGLKVVIFDIDDAGSVSSAQATLEGADYPFTILFDTEKKVYDQLGIRRIPTTVLFDKNGKELWRHVGYESGVEDTVAEKVESYLPAE
jgi:cytochrome c biogenesis protein CcmG, thiol:disulfide interchange protein DsbE